jgi:dipeptidase E
MSKRRLLLLSNSKNFGQGYLEHAESHIKDFLGARNRKVLFIPFAAVRITFDDFAALVGDRFRQMGYELDSIHRAGDARQAVAGAEAIAVGGGNTFHLLHQLYENDLLDIISKRVGEGMPYLGWSAGSNVACPTIKTTNDMPIIEPRSFNAARLVPFQINPHYLDHHPEGHQGETRQERILEFVEVNPGVYVVGLREGSILRVEGDTVKMIGEGTARVFLKGREAKEYGAEESLRFLLDNR